MALISVSIRTEVEETQKARKLFVEILAVRNGEDKNETNALSLFADEASTGSADTVL